MLFLNKRIRNRNIFLIITFYISFEILGIIQISKNIFLFILNFYLAEYLYMYLSVLHIHMSVKELNLPKLITNF